MKIERENPHPSNETPEELIDKAIENAIKESSDKE